MTRLAVFALLGFGALAGCVPGPGDPYGYGYGYAAPPAPDPYYGGGYVPYAEPTVVIGGGPDYRYRDGDRYREQRYREQAYRNQGYRERQRENRAPEQPRIVGNTIQNPRGIVPAQGFGGGGGPRPQPNPSTLPGAIPQNRNTIPIGGGP